MAQFYTQEEAAQRLGIPLEEFKRRIKTEWTTIQPLRDGATLRYRCSVIDELARVLGEASNPGLSPSDFTTPLDDSNDQIIPLTTGEAPANEGASKSGKQDEPLLISDDEDILSGNFAKASGDSDVRLDFGSFDRPATPENMSATEEFEVDLAGPSSAIIKPSSASGKLSAPKSGTKLAGPDSGKLSSGNSGKNLNDKADDSSSEFELSLDSSNDSLELEITSDSSDEVDLGSLDGSTNLAGQSGLNLSQPADSGLSLEKKAPKTGPIGKTEQADDDSVDDFELSLDVDDSDPGLRGPKSAVMSSSGPASDSEFELTLDEDSGVSEAIADELQRDAGKGDIFETDFELPSAEDSSSELVAAEDQNSDFDLDVTEAVDMDDESSSQVLLVDDDVVEIEDDENAAPRRGRSLSSALDDEDLVEGASASGALRGIRRGEDDEEEFAMAGSGNVTTTQPEWGALPAVVLGLTMPLMLLGTLMSYENIRSMWGYHQPSQPGSVITRPIAEELFGKLGD